MITICNQNCSVQMDETSLLYTIRKDEAEWKRAADYQPKIICEQGELLFSQAKNITHSEYSTGYGKGILSTFDGFEVDGAYINYAFQTYVWIEETTNDVYFEWIPLKENGLTIQKVLWPGKMEFDEPREDWYTLLTHQQGILIPNTWKTALSPIVFDGFFETAGGYMPWYGQVKQGNGYIAICTTPWNAG